MNLNRMDLIRLIEDNLVSTTLHLSISSYSSSREREREAYMRSTTIETTIPSSSSSRTSCSKLPKPFISLSTSILICQMSVFRLTHFTKIPFLKYFGEGRDIDRGKCWSGVIVFLEDFEILMESSFVMILLKEDYSFEGRYEWREGRERRRKNGP